MKCDIVSYDLTSDQLDTILGRIATLELLHLYRPFLHQSHVAV